MTMPFFCAVPPTLPADPEGVGAFTGTGPYFISEYVRGRRVVLSRNRFYRGTRPHHVDSFTADLTADSGQEILDRIERGDADWGVAGPPEYFDPGRRLVAKYGVNKRQFFVRPGLALRLLVFNTSGPLFRQNAALRRAVNFAIDRAAVRGAGGPAIASRLTDQYLPPSTPGFRDEAVYPLRRPNPRALARGHRRGGKAIFWVRDFPPLLAMAQTVKQNLSAIGLEVEVKAIPLSGYAERLTRDRSWDIAWLPWSADYLDAYSYLNVLLDGRFIGATNVTGFDSPRYNRRLRQAARLQGTARYQAYGKLDVEITQTPLPSPRSHP